MQLALFEDAAARRFLPLTWTRPVYDLRSGIFTLREKLANCYAVPVSALFCRPFLAAALAERTGLPVNRPVDGPVLLLNGRLVATPALPQLIPAEGPPTLFLAPNGAIAAARLPAIPPSVVAGGEWPEVLRELSYQTVESPSDLKLLEWPWELIHHAEEEIAADASSFPLGTSEGEVHPGAHLVGSDMIYLGPGARVAPGAVLDATRGPIVIGAEAEIMPNAVLVGPLTVGPRSLVKVGAKLYQGTAIGPVCKVGGEVEATIFQGYSNKQHDGFVGHSFIGEWCNLGADTNTSDLKNNYSTVRIWTADGMADSGQLMLGTLMGDHVKTGINVMLNSGTVIGVAANVFGAGLPPKHVPAFAWGGADGFTEHELERALATAARVMARRGLSLSTAEADVLRAIFEATSDDRHEMRLA